MPLQNTYEKIKKVFGNNSLSHVQVLLTQDDFGKSRNDEKLASIWILSLCKIGH